MFGQLFFGRERDGDIVAVPIAEVLYMRETAIGVEIYLRNGFLLEVEGSLSELGFMILGGEEEPEQEEEGVAPT